MVVFRSGYLSDIPYVYTFALVYYYSPNLLSMKRARPIVFIYPKDVQLITRKTERHAAMLIRRIQVAIGKEPYQPLTVSEFCAYMKLNEEELYGMLGY